MADSIIYRNVQSGYAIPAGKGVYDIYTLVDSFEWNDITDSTAGSAELSDFDSSSPGYNDIRGTTVYYGYSITPHITSTSASYFSQYYSLDDGVKTTLSRVPNGAWVAISTISDTKFSLGNSGQAMWKFTRYTVKYTNTATVYYSQRRYFKRTDLGKVKGTYSSTHIEETNGRPETEGIYNGAYYVRVA